MKKRYLRFGIIPKDNKSRNFIKNNSEIGVSVFDLEKNIPIINNFKLLESFSSREDVLQFLVTGDVIGIGQDGEPLLKNVKYIKPVNFNVREISEKILNNSFNKKDTILGNYTYDYCYLNYSNGLKIMYKENEYSKPTDDFLNNFKIKNPNLD